MTRIITQSLHLAMARSGIGTTELAERAGISTQTLWRSMYKGKPVRLSTAGRIARALGVDVTEIATINEQEVTI